MTDLFANRYDIQHELGRGSFGVVFLAYDTRLRNRPVALKVLHAALNNDPATVSRFHSEAGILAGLEHDHIVPVYDVDIDQGTRFIVMKYVPGPTLAAIIEKKGPQTPERVLAWLEQIAEGLDYAHHQQVLHRDLKPSNILLDEERNRIVISDFGLAKAVQASGGSSVSQSAATMTGTAYYMAPEVIKGEKHTTAADLYSLGCVLYELLSAERPFEGENFIAVTSQHVLNPTPTLALTGDTGELMAEQVAALMAKEPEARPQRAGLVYGSVVAGLALLETTRQVKAARSAQEVAEAQRAEAARLAELERQQRAEEAAKQAAIQRQQREAEQARLAELERQKRAAEAALAAERARIEAEKREKEKKGAWWRSPILWTGAIMIVIIGMFLISMMNSQSERNASATATAVAIAAVIKTAEVTPTEESVIVVPTDTPIPPTPEPPTATSIPPTRTPVPYTPMPTATLEVNIYIVQRGDSFASIANSFGISFEELVTYNSIREPYILYVNQELKIPSADYTPLAQSPPTDTPVPPTPTPEPDTPTPVLPTATPVPVIQPTSNINVRSGPGTNYLVIGTALASRPYALTGRNGNSSWWQINLDGRSGWVIASLVSSQGDTASVAIITPPPAPRPTNTPAPQPTSSSQTYPAPVLISPEQGFSTDGNVTFQWSYNGPALTSNQGFEVRVWKEGQDDHYGAADPFDSTSSIPPINLSGAYGVQQGGSGEYFWTVAVVQRRPYKRIGEEALPQTLIYSGGKTTKATPTAAPP